jgi:hypothetical protein
MPVPAPAPMIGLPWLIFCLNRPSVSSRLNCMIIPLLAISYQLSAISFWILDFGFWILDFGFI